MTGKQLVRNTILLPTLAALAVVFLYATMVLADTQTEDDTTDMNIKQVMRHAMTRGLCQKVIKKKATQEEQERLVALLERLAECSPPVGESSSWKKKASDLAEAARAVAKGEEAHKRLRKAANCAACHRDHRPK